MRKHLFFLIISLFLSFSFSLRTLAANTDLVAPENNPVNSTRAIAEAEFSTLRVVRIGETYDSRYVAISSGSGFVISPGIVLTNYHVISESPDEYLFFKNIIFLVVPTATTTEKPRQGKLIDQWEAGDMALLEVKGLRASPLPFAIEPQKNESVQAIGYPVNTDKLNHLTVDEIIQPQPAYITKGNIALFSEKNPNGEFIATVFHTAAIDGGNSGGPLIDDCGRVVGINTWVAATTIEDGGINTHPGQFISTRSTEIVKYLEGQKIAFEARTGPCYAKTEQEIKAQIEINRKVEAQQLENEQKLIKEKKQNVILKIIIAALIMAALSFAVYYFSQRIKKPDLKNTMLDTENLSNGTIETVSNGSDQKLKKAIIPIFAGAAALIFVILIIKSCEKPKQIQMLAPKQTLICSPVISETIGDETPSETEFVFDPNTTCVNGRTAYRQLDDGSFERVMFKTSKTTVALLTISKDLSRFQRQTFKLNSAQAAMMEAKKSAYGDVQCTALDSTHRSETDAALDDIARAASEATAGEPVAKATWACKPR